MKKCINHRVVLAALAFLAWGVRTPELRAASTQDATITVTPVADVSLSLNTTTYDFGAISVNTSTNSATALTLTNNGQVTVAVDKRISNQSNPAGWAAGAAPAVDTYVIYCATSTARMGMAEFTGPTLFGAQAIVTNLTGSAGTQPLLPPQGAGSSVNLWFRLDMPTKVSSLTGRTITVRFTGTAQ